MLPTRFAKVISCILMTNPGDPDASPTTDPIDREPVSAQAATLSADELEAAEAQDEELVPTEAMVLNAEEIEAAEAQIVEQSKRIEFYLTEYSVELLADKMKKGDFFVPPYQREFTWETSRQSRFIESLLMGLPIPFLFFWEDPKTGRLEIVDGSQRLRTIESFIHGDLKLGELEGLTLVSGFRFADLPESRQRKIKNRSIRGIVLNEHADEQARFDLFDRINTGSKIANTAEVRRGALSGPFLDLVVKLADDPLFTGLAPVSPRQFNEREREELVTRFFAYGDGLEGYENKVAPFIYAYTKKMNEAFTRDPKLEAAYEERVVTTFARKHPLRVFLLFLSSF